jgi:2-polyprenyl-3-methyl-5-hydroxy-6-metoxy-1,4-benzoquinol methylase
LEFEDQRRFWNEWNAATRERALDEISMRQAQVVRGWLGELGLRNCTILEIGCGAGWFCPMLAEFGRVTGTDLSDKVLERARVRAPEVEFVAGDFMALDFGQNAFDVAVALEVIAHVPDQTAFVAKIAYHLRPGGYLMMATQNKPVLQRFNRVPPPGRGQLRQWLDAV